jgi:hypothetical protein
MVGPLEESEFFQRVSTPAGEVPYYRPISEARAAELLALLDAEKQRHFYMMLAHEMTVLARGTIISRETIADKQARERWYWMNEMMHGLTLQIEAASGDRPERLYSPVDFCRSMYEKARRGGFEWEFAINCVPRLLWRQLNSSR